MKSNQIAMVLVACLLAALAWAGSASAQQTFLLSPNNSGAQWQIGTGLKLPIGPEGIFDGGLTMNDADNIPLLNVPPAAGATVMQDFSTSMGGRITVPANAFMRPANGTENPGEGPRKVGVLPSNPTLFQVGTSLSHKFPAVTAVFSPGGAPGPATLPGAGGIIRYSGGAKAFGGPAQFRLKKGAGAGITGALSPNALGEPPNASVWVAGFGNDPVTVMTVGVLGAGFAGGGVMTPGGGTTALAPVGASVAAPGITTMWGTGTVVAVNVTDGAGGLVCCEVGPNGTILSSVKPGAAFPLSNMVTSSKGFPWTTGRITISQPDATPDGEVFFISGTDTRDTQGTGNVTLVSGALSQRAVSGPNANRGWVRMLLPEPGAALGAAGALGLLGVCRVLVQRRRVFRG